MSQKLANSSIKIYDYDQRIARTQNLFKKEFSNETVELIQNYHNSMISESIAKATQHKHLQTLLNLCRFLKKEWKDATRQDIDALVAKIVQTYSENGKETHTTHDHKKVLKIFFRWYKLGSRSKVEVGDPPETKHVKVKKVNSSIIREDLLTEDDRTRLLYACGENARDRAFIDCHLEAGTRPGEILNLQIKHVKFDKNGAIIHVDGKTGQRPIRLIKSVPNLKSWMNVHPFKENKDAPLWPILTKRKYGQSLAYNAALQMVKRRCEIAHLEKRVYLNLFRHSEATQTAKFMTEAQMKQRHGWTMGSKMASRYVHLVNADVDEAIFKHYGIMQEETKVKSPKVCHVCNFVNDPESSECSNCDKPLDLKTALEKQRKDYFEKESQLKLIDELKKAGEKLSKRSIDQDKVIKSLVVQLHDLESKYVDILVKDFENNTES